MSGMELVPRAQHRRRPVKLFLRPQESSSCQAPGAEWPRHNPRKASQKPAQLLIFPPDMQGEIRVRP